MLENIEKILELEGEDEEPPVPQKLRKNDYKMSIIFKKFLKKSH